MTTMKARNSTMRKAKTALILSVPVIFTLLALGVSKLNSDEKKLLTLQFDKIQTGMGISEVTTLIGQPEYEEYCEGRSWDSYYSLDNKERWMVDFDSAGKVIKKEHIFTTPDDTGIVPGYAEFNHLLRKLFHRVTKLACA